MYTSIPEGEFQVRKFGVRMELGESLVQVFCNFAINLQPNSFLNPNFGTKNSPSKYSCQVGTFFKAWEYLYPIRQFKMIPTNLSHVSHDVTSNL